MDPLAFWGRGEERQDEAAARPPYGDPPMDPLAIWGRGHEEAEAAFRAMVARRQRFDAALALEKTKPSQRRLLQLWRAASNDASR